MGQLIGIKDASGLCGLSATSVITIQKRKPAMAEVVTKPAVKAEDKKPQEKGSRSLTVWPFANLRREIDRLFDDFEWGHGAPRCAALCSTWSRCCEAK